jgi:DNA-binding transcriptional MerR regulator
MARIASVERETGISKETLRIWERRYGFPQPERTGDGIRSYSDEDIVKLRLTKRLLDRGLRAGEIVPKSLEQLEALDQSSAAVPPCNSSADDASRPSFRVRDIDDFRLWLHERARALSTEAFVLDVIRPLCTDIGIAWQRNEIGIFEEHLLSEQIAQTLRHLIARFDKTDQSPRILLTTLPGERHGFGLLMLQCLLASRGLDCLPLGVETPMEDIVKCVESAQIDLVALSFSSHFPARRVRSVLQEIRALLPPTVAIVAGGGAIGRIRTRLPGIVLLSELSEAVVYIDGVGTRRSGQ